MTDHQNKPRRVFDNTTNNLVWYWDPDAFGVKQPTEVSFQTNLRFPGQYYDEQSGLYYNHNRYYNPQLGRYMEPDPIGLEGGLNPYAYAGNNPVMNVDPTGLIYADEARSDMCYAQPFETRMYVSPQPEIPKSQVMNPYPTGNCFTDRIASTFSSDLAMAVPFTSAVRAISLAKAPVVGQYSLGKAAVIGFGAGSGLDALSQYGRNDFSFSNFNYQESAGVGAVGALAGIYGTSLANGAGVVPVSWLNLRNNLNNPAGLVIFGNQLILNQAGSRTIKSVTNR